MTGHARPSIRQAGSVVKAGMRRSIAASSRANRAMLSEDSLPHPDIPARGIRGHGEWDIVQRNVDRIKA